jgi:hypothetical protein
VRQRGRALELEVVEDLVEVDDHGGSFRGRG